jgi:hypothetical protein
MNIKVSFRGVFNGDKKDSNRFCQSSIDILGLKVGQLD